MIHRLVVAVVVVGVSCLCAAQEPAEFAPADLTLTKRLLVRHKISELAFLKKDRGVVALTDPPALLQWTAHKPDTNEEPWTFTERTPIDDPTSARSLINRKTSPIPESDLRLAFGNLAAQREQVHVRYIFVPRSQPSMSARNVKRHFGKFRHDFSRMTFDQAAAQYSAHESASRGGDLGFIGHGILPTGADSFAFAAAPGQTSPILETETGLHVVRLEEHRAPVFEDVRAELEDQWLSDRIGRTSSQSLVASAANARRIAVASGHLIALYDLNEQSTTLVPAYAFVEPAPIEAIALTNGGNVVAIADASGISIRRLKGEGVREPIAGVGSAQSLLFAPNAGTLAVIRGRVIDLVSVPDRAVVASVSASDAISAIAFSPDSRALVTGDRSGNIEVWDATTYERVRNGEPGYDARYWTDRTWFRVASMHVDSQPRCFAFHPTGRLFVAGLASGTLGAFSLSTGGRMPLGPATPHNGSLIRATFSEDGTILLTAAEDDTMGVWAVPAEFKDGPKPRPRTFDELVAQHREVVRVHAEFRTKREELVRLHDEYARQASYLRDSINRIMTQQNLPDWRALEKLPEGNALLRGLQAAMGYRDELDVAIEVLRLSMIDLENMARFQVMEINARRVLQPEEFERFAAKLAELTAKAPLHPDPTVAPQRLPSFDRVWQYVLTGEGAP